ncbi:DoxX family membrane protein [Streptomyces sp. NPDC050610]|uniref:DoxX family membrane protein n=1 Tax=Streptomyces sp. NPDC050610 TaxID=3157097 RepID=UPI00343F4713
MSVDTRTPRPTGGSSPGYDDQPALSTVKVPSDPAQVIVNHLSFRVQLARPPRAARQFAGLADTAKIPVAAGPARRRAPVVWSGRTAPGDPAATELLQAVRHSGLATAVDAPRGEAPADAGSTQVLPRVRIDDGPPTRNTVVGPRGPVEHPPASDPPRELLHGVRPARGAYDEEPYGPDEFDDEATARPQRADDVRHAYYPGRRMNLGVVLLPLRVFLGLISVYAGMGKLCDPVYFDGGRRGSMVTWLDSLHPWAVASPLRDFALAHPVGAGLTVAFLQVTVGVLTVLGLWQRLAASVGALLSAALLLTVSWRTVPAYDAPDIIYLAAWSPLIIAGAPVYSLDGRLAGEAWRRLGPRSELWDLRKRVLRRGGTMAAFVTGVTLLVGSLLGGAVRSSDTANVPGPSDPPANHLPGSPLPQHPGKRTHPGTHGPSAGAGSGKPAAPGAKRHTKPSPAASKAPGTAHQPGHTGGPGQQPSQTQGGVQQPAPHTPNRPAAPAAPPHTSSGSPAGGSSGGGSGSGSGGSTGGGTAPKSPGSTSGSHTGSLGGLLG